MMCSACLGCSVQHSMIYFFHHYELPAIIQQLRTHREAAMHRPTPPPLPPQAPPTSLPASDDAPPTSEISAEGGGTSESMGGDSHLTNGATGGASSSLAHCSGGSSGGPPPCPYRFEVNGAALEGEDWDDLAPARISNP